MESGLNLQSPPGRSQGSKSLKGRATKASGREKIQERSAWFPLSGGIAILA
jgi:hypothetical protein